MTNPDEKAEQTVLALVPSIPRDDDGPVFREPWEAQAFALAVNLYQQGHFSWPEWAEILGAEIKRAQQAGDPDTGETYYLHWLAALERIVVIKKLTNTSTLDKYQTAWRRAAERTPHGETIEIGPADLKSSN